MPNLIYRKERVYFALLILFSLPLYFLLLLSGIGIILLFLLVALPLVAFFTSLATIRTNGVKVTKTQFPEMHQMVTEVSEKMGIQVVPDVYIIQSEGLLNAFATKFFRRNMIVLYSEIADLFVLEAKGELQFVIAHELAHIKQNHILKNLLILPGNWIPFLSQAYSRACEYTCDSMAAYYTKNLEASKQALTVLAIGKSLYHQVDVKEYLLEASKEQNVFAWIGEKFSTHPFLPKRINHLEEQFGQSYNINFRTSNKVRLVLATIVFLFVLVTVGSFFAFQAFQSTTLYSDFSLGSKDTTQLMLAASEGDIEKAQQLIEAGADVNAQDADGWTALHFAVMWNLYDYEEYGYEEEDELAPTVNENMVRLLLENGGDPNLKTNEEETILLTIVDNGMIDLLDLLLKHGADVNINDSYGDTALIRAVYMEDAQFVEKLLEAGAEKALANDEGLTAVEIAEDLEVKEIEQILKY
ncbi:M48 family metallopeptidase [Metabacillus herbersteinensis]|uniref:M48 family metallopeptidase n=1 Tax=Metabacillus herbersteinensis TaxID=283816 RepID=A0ABV6GJN3_9BACI